MNLLAISFNSLSWRDTTNCQRAATLICWSLLRQVLREKGAKKNPPDFKKINSYKEWGVLTACPRSFWHCCLWCFFLLFFFFKTGGWCKFAPRCRDVAVHQSAERSADAWPAWRLQRRTNAARPAHLWCSGMFHCWNIELQMISLSLSIFSLCILTSFITSSHLKFCLFVFAL